MTFGNPVKTISTEAKRVIDWTIKNRGNYIEWVGLDNVTTIRLHMSLGNHIRKPL